MEQHETDWRTILLLVGAAGGAVLAYAGAGLLVLYAGLGALKLPAATDGHSVFDYIVLAAAPIVIGTMFLPAVYYSIRRLAGRTATGNTVPLGMPEKMNRFMLGRMALNGPVALGFVYGLIVVLVWIGIALLAGRLVTNSVLKWTTPPLYVIAILIPAIFFVWVATRGLNPGSPQRRWGVLAAGVGLGILPAMAAELLLVLIVVLGLAVYLAFNPAGLATFQNLVQQLQNSSDMGQILSTAGPLLTNPIILLIALLFFSGLSPLIEEIAKSLPTWTVFDRLKSPAQGFAIGAISGAAFGLVESLLVSATPDAGWATTLLVRGASTMMHIMSASLTGWGIGRFRMTRRWLPLIEMYVAAMALHGLWNGSVVAITIGTVRSAAAPGRIDLPAMLLIYVGAAMLLLLCVAIPVAMWMINTRLRASEQPVPPATPSRVEESSIAASELPSVPAPSESTIYH